MSEKYKIPPMEFLISSLGRILQNITHSRQAVEVLVWVSFTTARRVLTAERTDGLQTLEGSYK